MAIVSVCQNRLNQKVYGHLLTFKLPRSIDCYAKDAESLDALLVARAVAMVIAHALPCVKWVY